MKFKSWTAGIAVLTLAAAPAFAEDSLAQWSYDQQVTPVGCDSGCCDNGYDCGDGCGCGSACGAGGLLSGIGPGYIEGFSIAGMLGIQNFDIGGWTQLGYHDEATLLTPVGGNSFNNTPGKVNIHQQYFYVGKKADGSKGFDIGGRADFIYGIDGPDAQSFGNPPGSFDYGGNGVGPFSSFTRGDLNHGWAIPQLYGEVAMGDLSVKLGHFYTIVGYETVPAIGNFFYSHSLTQYNTEPFTHSGFLGTYTGFENITMYGGWTSGWDTGFDSVNGGSNFIGGAALSLSDALTFTMVSTYGNFGAISTPGANNDYGHSAILTANLTNDLLYVFQTDYKKIDTTNDEDVSIVQYLIWTYNDILSFGSRVEWWKSDAPAFGGRRTSLCEYTTGVNIQLLDNMIMRPEYRKDWIPGANYDRDIFGCDMILTY